MMKDSAPTGSYEFRVHVSDGVWPDVVSAVHVHVKDLSDEAIHNSASLRLAGKPDLLQDKCNPDIGLRLNRLFVGGCHLGS